MRKKDLKLVREYVDKFVLKDKLELVLFTGSRVFGIKNTDFDLCVIGKYPSKYLRKYSVFVSLEKYPKKYKGEEFEIQVVNWDFIKQGLQSFLSSDVWHFNNALILFDKNKKFTKLKKKYNKIPKKQMKSYIFELYESGYDNLVNAIKAKKRGYKSTMVFHLVESINDMLKILYLVNKKFIPPTKWRLYFLKELNIKGLSDKSFLRLNISKVRSLVNFTGKLILKKKILALKDFKVIKGD